jgi:hypothetical protein
LLCHVTNQTGQTESDLEKGEADGTADALAVIASVARSAMKIAELEVKKRWHRIRCPEILSEMQTDPFKSDLVRSSFCPARS